MLKGSVSVLSVGLLSLVLLTGCGDEGHSEHMDDKDEMAENEDSTGVAACDEYFEYVTSCMDSLDPAIADSQSQALESLRTQLSSLEEADATQACTTALDAAKQSLAAAGC